MHCLDFGGGKWLAFRIRNTVRDKTLHLGWGCTCHWQRGENLLKMKMLVVHETELYSQSPVTLNKLNIQMPERKDVTLLRDSITGKPGFSAHFTLAVCSDRDKSPFGCLKQVIQS